MNKKIKIIYIAAAILSVALLAAYLCLMHVTRSDNAPEIKFSSEIIEVKTTADSKALLQGVTASDAEDGDVTDSLIVESISHMTENNTATVAVAAFDSDNHVTKATRTVKFEDYNEPRFTLDNGLVFRLSNNLNVLDYVGAQDMFDGDLSSRVKYTLESSAANLSSVGEHEIELRVTNSVGDTAHLIVNVEVCSTNPNPADIQLSQYIVYLEAGEELDAESYAVSHVESNRLVEGSDGLTISDDGVDTDTPGVYTVTYTYSNGSTESHTRLFVVVE